MRLKSRILMATLALAVGAGTHVALVRHLRASRPRPSVSLYRPLAELPKRLGDWHGVDIPHASVFADEHFTRIYRHAVTAQEVTATIFYSASAEDRKHNPLLCAGVAGYQENPKWRKSIAVEGHAAPVQQYRLEKPGSIQFWFYWHYLLKSSNHSATDRLVELYQQFHALPSSVSIAVSTRYVTENGGEAREFVRLLDAALQSHIGPDAIRGNDNAPVMAIGTDGFRASEERSSRR